MRKRIASIVLIASMCMTLSVPTFAVEGNNSYVTRFGVSISSSEYQALIDQGLGESDIDYLDEKTFKQYMDEAGGELISQTESYYICKDDGTNIEVPQNIAEAVASDLNLGIMPTEDEAGYDYANDSVCRLALSLYKFGYSFRSTATVKWLYNPKVDSQDILGITHNGGLVTDANNVTATMWYDYTDDGVNYITKSASAASIKTEVGSGVVCKFNRKVLNPQYLNRNFVYKVEIRSTKNDNSIINAVVQADYFRGTTKLAANLEVDAIAILAAAVTGQPYLAAISLVPKFESAFADVLQADLMYTINP